MKKLFKIGLGLCLFFEGSYANIEKESTDEIMMKIQQESQENDAEEEVESVEIKHSLLPTMQHIYDIKPDEVDSLDSMLSEGMFYGRLRFNSFGFKWGEEEEGSKKDHFIAAIGASLFYKSPVYNGLSFSAGLFTAQAAGSLGDEESHLYKGGRDTLSRYSALHGDPEGITSLAEAYVEYSYDKFSFKGGRQIFESFLTRSNDTKMIPNTFEGLTVTIDDMLGTYFEIGYLTKQKLRDHQTFHHLLAYGDDPEDPYGIYRENDDSVMHRGLTLPALQERGIKDRLVIVEAKNRQIANLSLGANFTAVPELIASTMLQASYRVDLGTLSIVPGIRYMRQFDNGAGEIGGANLKGNTEGYKEPATLDSALLGARVDFVDNGYKLRLGYSKVADKGDIVAPWRGFPTAAFTRAMGQYNWNANTESYMAQLEYDYNGFTDLKIVSQYVIQDFDDNKAGVQADSNVFVLNLMKGFGYGGDSNIYLKTRYAYVTGKEDIVTDSGYQKPDPSYSEIRFELNYLF
ncbi:MAG: hypothetical protein JW682_00845 [Campylobacterales bacterium]|nr:hypothetical protein [Campylobacterales bacterium]HEO99013.1 hypothetical protein [Campylobacterota bacterium]